MDFPKTCNYRCSYSTSNKSNRNHEKENPAASRRAEACTRASSKCCAGGARSTNAKKETLSSHGMLSSAASLTPQKKLKTLTQSKGDDSSRITRPVLQDLDKNISKKHTNIQAVKTVLFKDVGTETSRSQRKVASETRHVVKANKCCTKHTNLTDSEKLRPRTGAHLRVPPTTNKLTTLSKTPIVNTFATGPKLEKITVRPKGTPHPQKIWNRLDDCEAEEVFVDSSKHYITFTPLARSRYKIEVTPNKARYISPIKSSVERCKSTVIFQGIPEGVRRPAIKLTLMQKRHPESKKDKSKAYSLDIYQMEYLQDIIYCQLKNDWKYVLKVKSRGFHDSQNTQNRIAVVNWLIQAHDYLDLSSPILFATIRLFDNVLDSTSIACNMYQLIGLVIMWIVSKFEDRNVLKSSKMLALCKDIYSNQDFLQMEKKLLTFFNFDIKIPDITLYTAYYLKKLDIESDQLLYAALYILECYALRSKFSTVIPSIQAAAAIHLTLNILHPLLKVWKRLEKVVGYYSEEELDNIKQEMLLQLHKMLDTKYQYRQPYTKYAQKDKLQVSILVMQKITAV